jgi:hypothetical protein
MIKKVEMGMREWKIEPPLSRAQLIQIGTSKHLNLKISYMHATEAILYCRG